MAMAIVPKIEFDINDKNLETFSLVWLDARVNSNEHNLAAQKQLRATINFLKTFDNANDCRKYIKQVSQGHYIVLIVSGSLGQYEVPHIHNIYQVSDIYVYCMDKPLHETWAKQFKKVKAVVTDLSVLISQIKSDQKNRLKLAEFLSFNIFFSNDTKADQSTISLNGQFVHWQVLMNVLLRLKYTEKDKKELIDLCKIQYKDNMDELNTVKEFEQSYSSDKAIWWYTRECFLYKILNKALRVQDIHILFLLRSFSRDIYEQLKKNQCPSPVRVYRGQLVSKEELSILRKSTNQLMSMNSFFSTSMNPKQALIYSSGNAIPNDLERVFFEIDADPRVVTTKPFANIISQSAFGKELEVLFMFGSIFRLNQINRENNGVWKIRMTLCGDQENDLKEVLEHMKDEYGNKKANLQLLGTVLWKMGKIDLAERYYHRMIDELPANDRLRIALYNDLGEMAAIKGDLDASIQWKKKSLEIKAQTTNNNTGTSNFKKR